MRRHEQKIHLLESSVLEMEANAERDPLMLDQQRTLSLTPPGCQGDALDQDYSHV